MKSLIELVERAKFLKAAMEEISAMAAYCSDNDFCIIFQMQVMEIDDPSRRNRSSQRSINYLFGSHGGWGQIPPEEQKPQTPSIAQGLTAAHSLHILDTAFNVYNYELSDIVKQIQAIAPSFKASDL